MEPYQTHDYDVLVIGAGGAGLRAAIEASSKGVRVGVITKSLLGKAHTVMAEGGIAAETRQVLENLKAVLEAAGSSLERVVKVTIYMVDLGELAAMNEVFSQYFPLDPPARTTFECSRLVNDARVEIEAIAMV